MGLLAVALLAQSMQSWAQSSPAPVPIRFAYSLSTTTFPILYAQKNGIFSKHGLDVKATQFANFEAVYTAFRSGAVDIGSGGLASIVNLRGNGVPIKVVWGTTRMSNDILVSPKSGITDPKQLQGKTLGIFGGAAGTTANMFIALMANDYGFDPRSAASVRYGASGLLAGLLAKGDIAAFVGNDPVTAIELASGRAVSIGELSDLYAKRHGGYKVHAGALALSDKFAKDHPDGINRFLGAWLEAVRALQNDPSLWLPMMKDHLQIDDAATANLLKDRVSGLFAMEWTEKNIQGEIESLKFMNRAAGKGFLDKIPDDAFLSNVKPR
jgi:ABC-type nitrate/sulfonate/bicarbonate transport system substrate-binding protein